VTAGIVAWIEDKNRRVFVTDWTEARETREQIGEPTPTTPAIIAAATAITVKGSAEAIIRDIGNMRATDDDIKPDAP
jgi:hypothetical protein